MNNETNESNNIINQQKNDNNNSKENGAIINSKSKFKKVKSSVISNNNLYEITTPSRRNLKKIENILKQSLKTKHSTINKKGKNERDINKKNTINSINDFQNEQSKKNLLGGSISPKNIRKIKIDDNDNEINIINLYQMTDKLYTNDDHFQKDFIIKNKLKDKNGSSNIIKRNKFMSGRMNNMFQKKKLIITFGLNEGNINIKRKQSFVKDSEKNFLFKRKITNITKGFDSELNKSKEKSNFSYYLKLKNRLRSPSKDINEDSNGINNGTSKHKHESYKNNEALHYCRTNNDKNFTRRNSQFFRAKTNKSIKHIESPKKIKEEEKEETYIKLKKANNIKMDGSSKKSNNIKDYNKTQIPNDNVEIPKKEQKEQKKQKKSKFCFFCCLTNKLNDYDEL